MHYVLDLWVHGWRRTQAQGDVIVVRWADDFVRGFQHRGEAERFLAELKQRFARFGLQLHPDKTRLVECGRFAAPNRAKRGEGKPETFDVLGFTHICGKTRKGGFTVQRITMRKRWQAKLKEIHAQLRQRMHDRIPEQGVYLRSVVGGHIRYYGVPFNSPAIGAFRKQVGWLWHNVLKRRSQKHNVTWERMEHLIARYFPPARVCHPYPRVRLGVST